MKQIIHYLEITKETQSNTLTIDHISNVRKWKLQQMETKQVSFRFKQGVAVNKKVMCYGFNFKNEYTGEMSERGENVKPSVTNNSGFRECSGSVGAARKVLIGRRKQ